MYHGIIPSGGLIKFALNLFTRSFFSRSGGINFKQPQPQGWKSWEIKVRKYLEKTVRKRMGTKYIYIYIFSCTNSDNIYPSGISAIHCPAFLMSVDLFLLSLLWNFYGISLRVGEINSPSFDIVFLVFFFFSNRTSKYRNIQQKYLKYSGFICFIVFYIFYLVIKNIFKRELKREKTDKNLKIDSANFYQNHIFQDTRTRIFYFYFVSNI